MTLFHATTGCLLRIVTAPLRSHDLSQAQRVQDALRPGDIVVADRGFCSYAHLALLQNLDVFAVFRLHQKTIVNFRKGRAYVEPSAKRTKARRARGKPRSRWVRWLGTCDQIVEYFKPKQRPKWMTAEAYVQLPDSIQVRELRYRVTQRGYRVKEVLLLTTLLDAQLYPATELATLYQQRWEIETNLRHLKQTTPRRAAVIRGPAHTPSADVSRPAADQPGRFAQGPEEKLGTAGRTAGLAISVIVVLSFQIARSSLGRSGPATALRFWRDGVKRNVFVAMGLGRRRPSQSVAFRSDLI